MKKQCNVCGNKIRYEGSIPCEDYIEIHKTWGYASHKDGMNHKMILCENCYDAWIKTFQIPVEETEETELL